MSVKVNSKFFVAAWIAAVFVIIGLVLNVTLPKQPQLTRAALAKEVITGYKIPVIKDLPQHFTDVKKGDKYYDYIETAYYLGFIQPKGKSFFGADTYADQATKRRAFYLASKYKVALDFKKSTKTEVPDWVKPEIEDALDKIVAAYTSTGAANTVLGGYDTIPIQQALSKPAVGIESIQKSTNIVKIDAVPDWYAGAEKVAVGVMGKYAIKDSSGALVEKVQDNVRVNVAYKDGTYVVGLTDGKFYAGKSAVKITPLENPQVIEFTDYKDIVAPGQNYNKFRGEALIAYSAQSKRLWAINELYIDDYLKGIREAAVGDSLEYFKAITVVSRSYAYHYALSGGKHRGEPFHLKNSRNGNGNDQVYAGYNLEPSFATQGKAVEQTTGEVVTYNGKVIIAPFSSGTDGKSTKSAEQVWGRKDMPWARGVPDPYGYIPNWATLSGNHMVGFSAQGARGFISKENKSYDWVIKYYYNNVKVEKKPANIKIKVAIYSVPAA